VILWGVNLPAGSDTPQKKSCRISDPVEQNAARSETPRN
jgi:hypothetical protein